MNSALAEIKQRLAAAQSQARGAVALSLDDCERLIRALELAIRQRDGMHECIVKAGERGFAFDDSGIRGDLNAAIDKILGE